MRKKLINIAILSSMVLTACGSQMSDETSMEEATVVATVNGVEITKAQVLQRVTMLTQGQGQPATEDSALNQLIDEELVYQDAAAKGIEVTDEEVGNQYDVVVQNSGGAELLESKLVELNLTPDALRKDIGTQLLIQKYLESEVNLEDIEVTDEEVQTAYDDLAATQDVPPLDDSVKAQIRDQLTMQKKNTRALEHVQVLRENADIQMVADAEEMEAVEEATGTGDIMEDTEEDTEVSDDEEVTEEEVEAL